MIKCNSCWKKFEAQDVSYITSCCHIFCEDCANKQFSKERICPSCDQSVGHRGGISRNVLAVTPEKTVQLCGLSPKEIMSITSKALEFWSFQVQGAFEYERIESNQAQSTLAQMEKAYTEKMEESLSKISSLKRQLEAMSREIETDKQQIAELEEKYSEKSRQKRKLEELYDSLKSKFEHTGVSNTISTRNMYSMSMGRDEPQSRFGRLSPAVPSRSPRAAKITEERIFFGKSPAKPLDKLQKSPRVPQSAVPSFVPNSPKRTIFRTVKIPESPRFSRFGKVCR